MMLKKLIPAAALLALAGAAHAQVTIYGLADVGFAKTTTEDAAGTAASLTASDDERSRLARLPSADWYAVPASRTPDPSMTATTWSDLQTITLSSPSQVVSVSIPPGQTRYFFRALTQ
jgi:hypothetical protein